MQGLCEQDARGDFADGFIQIRGKDGEKFNAVFRAQGIRGIANCQFAFACGVTRTEFFAQAGANFRLLRLPSEPHA